MQKKSKVLCAMSGGVDSSVTATLLKEQGYQVIGVTMQIFDRTKEFGGCCGLSEIEDAKAVCNILNIPHYTLNFREEFQNFVINNFIEEYKNGRTPNPCIRCNQFLKFDLLIKKAEELGCNYIATGHYARIKFEIRPPQAEKFEINSKSEISNIYKLLKGIDEKKDQSYVLYTMNQESLSRTIFPLGEFTKKEVRKLAKRFKLPIAEKKESQEICFIQDNNYGRFLQEKIPESVVPGNILNTKGEIAGKHNGVIFYTIGQKKGIGAHGKRKFVTRIDVKNNTITIGDNDNLLKDSLIADNLSFVSGQPPAGKVEAAAKIRYNSREAPAILEVKDNQAEVYFREKQRAVTPGQSVVFYQGDEAIGGGIIN